MIEKEDRILNNFKTYSRSPLNNFKRSDLDIFMKIHEDSISADSSKSKDDNSKEIQRNRRKSARTPKMSAKLLQYLTEHPDTQESLISPDSNTQ